MDGFVHTLLTCTTGCTKPGYDGQLLANFPMQLVISKADVTLTLKGKYSNKLVQKMLLHSYTDFNKDKQLYEQMDEPIDRRTKKMDGGTQR